MHVYHNPSNEASLFASLFGVSVICTSIKAATYIYIYNQLDRLSLHNVTSIIIHYSCSYVAAKVIGNHA